MGARIRGKTWEQQKLDEIGWSARRFARHLGKPEGTVASWVVRGNMPHCFAVRLAHIAHFLSHLEPVIEKKKTSGK